MIKDFHFHIALKIQYWPLQSRRT